MKKQYFVAAGLSGGWWVLVFLGCLWMLPGFVVGQDAAGGRGLQGTVVESTGGAIPGARITLLDSRGSVKATTATNAEGRFSISGVPPGKYTLQVESTNFDKASQEVIVSSGDTNKAALVITPRLASLQQSINVTAEGAYAQPDAVGATKTDMPIMETPVSVQVIPQQVLKDQQVVALDQAIQNVSGVIPNIDSYGTNDSFSIRGFDAMEMTYEDGMRLDQYTTSGFAVDMANTEKVEVIKGPASVLYGQAEPGGVVNVVTGVYIWWGKREVRRFAAAQAKHFADRNAAVSAANRGTCEEAGLL